VPSRRQTALQAAAKSRVLKIKAWKFKGASPMNSLSIYATRVRRSHPAPALSIKSTDAGTASISKLATIAIRVLCLTLVVVFTAIAGLAQTANTTTDGWVVLPVDEYRALRRLAFPADAEPVLPPVDATLTRIDYDLKVDGDLASGTARLTVDVIKDGWVRLALPDGLMVREASLDGRPVTLATRPAEKGPGSADLLLSHTGRFVLTLKIVAPVTSVAGTDILKLPVSNSAVSHAVVELNRLGIDVQLSGGLLLEHTETATGSRWVANGRGNEPLAFGWRRRVDDQRANQALRLRGAITELVGLGEDATQINAEIQLEVLQGVTQEVRLLLPDQLNVNQVSGATVADWDVSGHELAVTFIEPVLTSARFTLSGELRLPRSGKLEVPLIRLPAAERETGGVAVEVLGAGEIKDRQASGLDEAEAADLGQLISSRQSPSLLAFRLVPAEGKSARSLAINVARYTPQAILTANIEEAEYSTLITDDGKMLVQARFAVRNNQRNFLKLNLPADATLWSASVAGRPIRPGRATDNSLLLPLEKTKTGDDASAFVVEVSYLDHTPAWADKGRVRLSLVTVDLPISKSRLLVHHSPLFRVTPAAGLSGSFRQATYQLAETSALRTSGGFVAAAPIPTQTNASDSTQAMVSRLRETTATGRPMRNLPLRVVFPHFGPSIFLVAELTSESQTPVVEFDFQRDRKRGNR